MSQDRLFLRILGCGSSPGVPRLGRPGGDWGACDPLEPRNRRRRCAVLVERRNAAGLVTRVLIDTPPDLREQLLEAGVDRLDAVIFSHEHADQTHGIDDLRPLTPRGVTLPTYMDAGASAVLKDRFRYIFGGAQGYAPILEAQEPFKPLQPFVCNGPAGPISFIPLRQRHGAIDSYGFRIGEVAYTNDVVAFPPESFDALHGLKLWIVDAVRMRPAHPTHAHVDLVLEWVAALKPARTILTNLSLELDYKALMAQLPNGVEPAHDGWECELTHDFP